MKKVISISVMLFMLIALFSANAAEPQKKTSTVVKTTPIEVYYFHHTRRCTTCQAVETESQKSIKELYAKQLKDGKVNFISVNLDKKGSEVLAKKCKADGQALLVICKDKRIDLTDKGFMYAVSKPKRLKEELKNAIDPLLK